MFEGIVNSRKIIYFVNSVTYAHYRAKPRLREAEVVPGSPHFIHPIAWHHEPFQ